jgi:hypothetical protein
MAPMQRVMSHDAIIRPALVEWVCESFNSHNEVLSLVVTTMAPIQTDKNEKIILKSILLNFMSTILKSDSFLTVVLTTRYLLTKTVTMVEKILKVIPATG